MPGQKTEREKAMTESMRALLSGLFDYAGLFPPAKLGMSDATSTYARTLMQDHSFALGRFVCTVSRLEELSKTGAMVMPGTYATSGYTEMVDIADPWAVSAIIDGPLTQCLDMIDAFNEHHADMAHGRAKIDAIEMRLTDPNDVDDALDEIPDDLSVAFEVPKSAIFGGDPRGYVAAVSGTGAAAKIRCGGVTHDLFPTTEDVARFLVACHLGDAPFKATAGLHHPVRAEQRLTYEDDPPRGVMHGFLNLFVAAVLLKSRAIEADQDAVVRVLDETDACAFAFTDEALSWRDASAEVSQIARARESFALGIGSCSFAEPIDDLRELGLL